jgi:phosphoadenosine phosphosulfate reductase
LLPRKSTRERFRGDDPGLDLAALQALRPTTVRTDAVARTVIGDRVAEHLHRRDGYLAFSGGKDSLVVLDLVRRLEPDAPVVVFFDSGLEYPENLRLHGRSRTSVVVGSAADTGRSALLDVLAASGLWDHRATSNGRVLDLHEVLISGPARRKHELLGPGERWGAGG